MKVGVATMERNKMAISTILLCTKRITMAVTTQPMMVPMMRSARRWRVMLNVGRRMMTMVSTIQ